MAKEKDDSLVKTDDQLVVEINNSFAFVQNTIDEWKEKSKELVVTSIEEKDKMQQAALAEAMIGKVLNALEKKRKELKEESLRKGQLIDRSAKTISNQLNEIRSDLQKSALFEQNFYEERRLARLEKRRLALEPYEAMPDKDMLDMEDDEFDMVVSDIKKKFEDKKKAEALEAQRKLEAEAAERKRIADIEEENRKLKQQRDALVKLTNERNQKLAGLFTYVSGDTIANLGNLSQQEFDTVLTEAVKKKQKDVSEQEDRQMLQQVRYKAASQYTGFLPENINMMDMTHMTAPEFSDMLKVASEKKKANLAQGRLKELRIYDDPNSPVEYSGLETLSQSDFESLLQGAIQAFKNRIATQDNNIVDSSGMSERDKTFMVADAMRDYILPDMSTDSGKKIMENTRILLTKIEGYLREKAHKKWPKQ